MPDGLPPGVLLPDGLVTGASAPADGSASTVPSVALPAGVAEEDFAVFRDGIAISAIRAVPVAAADGGQDLVTRSPRPPARPAWHWFRVPSDLVARRPGHGGQGDSTAPNRAMRRIRTPRPTGGHPRRASGLACRAWPPGANRAPAWRAATRRAGPGTGPGSGTGSPASSRSGLVPQSAAAPAPWSSAAPRSSAGAVRGAPAPIRLQSGDSPARGLGRLAGPVGVADSRSVSRERTAAGPPPRKSGRPPWPRTAASRYCNG